MTGAPRSLAAPQHFTLVGREAVRLMGAKAAILFSRIVFRTTDGPWRATMQVLSDDTGLTVSETRVAVSRLVELGFIETAQAGGYDRVNTYIPMWADMPMDQHQDADAPIEERQAAKRARAKTPSTRIPDGFAPSEAHIAYARQNNLDLRHELETFKAHAAANDRHLVNWNSGFTMWLLKARPTQPAGRVVPFRPRPRPADGIDF